jgi:hypothetical protein
MSSNPKPKLHDDILIDTVEKMFFQKPKRGGNDKIDFRKRNPYTFFMVSLWNTQPHYNNMDGNLNAWQILFFLPHKFDIMPIWFPRL